MKKKRLVCGVGVNNANYVVQLQETVGYKDNGKIIQKLTWICPFYRKWVDMIRRCYSQDVHSRQPSYIECCTVPEWHYFMTFRSWMEKQDWEGKQLDKDILFPGNKIYGPETCVFVDRKVNNFFIESSIKVRGDFPVGVDFRKDYGKFRASGMDVATGKRKNLGHYLTAQEAYEAWLSFKLEQAYILAAEQTDPRVAKALINRYENYGKLNSHP